jgi:hypothetical protein
MNIVPTAADEFFAAGEVSARGFDAPEPGVVRFKEITFAAQNLPFKT